MCGVFGGVFPSDRNRPEQRLEVAGEALGHRGPDDGGTLIEEHAGSLIALGHKRLSIIDLSVAARQPFVSSDNRYVISYNGEIYNYLELRNELSELGHHFSTSSDTEVLIEAWAEWGVDCLSRLTGMFAFVIWDRVEAYVMLCRDAFGIKPLFYSSQNGTLLFASEIRAVLALQNTPAEINHQRAYEYLVREYYDRNEETFFTGINQLLPGHTLRYDLASGRAATPAPWNHFDISENSGVSFQQTAEKFREIFLKSVRLHLRSDVPLAAMLSGGLDSSSIVCAMRTLEPDMDIHTFSFIAPESGKSEEPWVNIINHHISAIPHKIILSPDDLIADLDQLILSQGEPFGSTSLYAQYGVCRAIRSAGIKVILDGQGADEMLAGYMGYPVPRLHSLLETGKLIRAVRFLSNWSRWPDRNRMTELKRAVDEMTTGRVNAFVRRLGGHPLYPDWVDAKKLDDLGVTVPHNRIAAADDARGRRLAAYQRHVATRRGLPLLLRHVDRNSMAFSIETRTPFLTTELAHFVMSLPESHLVSDKGETKSVLRAAMRGIVPDAILERKDKIGFEAPEYDWLKPHAEKIKRWLSQDLNLSWIDNTRVVSKFDILMSGQRALSSQQIWRWICFARWQKLHGLSG